MRTRPSARGLRLRRGFGVRQPLSVTLSENDVDGADNCCGIGEHVTLRHPVHRLHVAERGRADLAAIGLVAAVADMLDADRTGVDDGKRVTISVDQGWCRIRKTK